MAEKGLLKISPSLNDARYKQIFLTGKARSIYKEMLEKGTYTGNKLLDGMDMEEKIHKCCRSLSINNFFKLRI